MVETAVAWMRTVLGSITVEPVMLVDGAGKEAMLIYTENVQMNKICTAKLGYPPEVSVSEYVTEKAEATAEGLIFESRSDPERIHKDISCQHESRKPIYAW